MPNHISNQINELRKYMHSCKIDAVIIPSSDPHLSEYLPSHWKIRAWLSGFTGSAGTCVITNTKAGLWTDSRYYLQAEQQLKDTSIKLFKDGLEDTLSIPDFINSELPDNSIVAIDGEIVSIDYYIQLERNLAKHQLISDSLNINEIWKSRPLLPTTKAMVYGQEYSGETSSDKLKRVRSNINLTNSTLIITALDDIAWLLNIRGSEIKNNPVVISYLTVEENCATLYIDSAKLTLELKKHFAEANILTKEYNQFFKDISQFSNSLIFDSSSTNYKTYTSVKDCSNIKFSKSLIPLYKAKRNEVEINNLKKAMVKDGVAMVRFLMWLEKSMPNEITEIDIAEQLIQFRSQQENYKGESFETIAGYQEHGAIVHYTADKTTNKELKPEGLLLVDSGAQYLEGTTDITRTISLGEITNDQAIDYTTVLKGHIALAKAKFPKGTRGSQLDALARLPLWERKLNFLHGTGHGVGHYLCVHEGPQSIRMQENPTPLEIGMLTSNEPGLYITGKYGIRIESLLLTTPYGEGLFGQYLEFETVTLYPIDTKPIIKDLLSKEEIEWLNNYHKTTYNKLAPFLNLEERNWLKINTTKI